MSSTPQAPPVSESTRNIFTKSPRRESYPSHVVSLSSPCVLMVGRNGSWGSAVLKPVEKFGCGKIFVPPERATADYVREIEPAVILLDSTVSSEQRRTLTAALLGSCSTIFYSFPVENGCWWLPALLYGEDCHGTLAFRRSEFPRELERVFRGALAAD